MSSRCYRDHAALTPLGLLSDLHDGDLRELSFSHDTKRVVFRVDAEQFETGQHEQAVLALDDVQRFSINPGPDGSQGFEAYGFPTNTLIGSSLPLVTVAFQSI
jgi:hypothetical protein